MQKLVGVASGFLFVLSATIVSTAFQAQAPSIQETLNRLQKTLTTHGSRASVGYIRRFEPREFRACKISYELVPQLGPDHQGYVPDTERVTFQLTDLDAARISLYAGKNGTYLVGFRTVDQKQTIETRHAKEAHTFGDAYFTNSHTFTLTNKSAAEEVRSTLTQAIKLCQ